MDRRTFLRVLGGAGAAAATARVPILPAFADPGVGPDEFFIFIHAGGAWDVTLSLDPRNEKAGIIDPATSGAKGTIDPAPITRWVDDTGTIDGGFIYSGPSFKMVLPPGPSPLVFGPTIGNLLKHYARMTVINGISMNTVAHQDGTAFSATGRHLAGTKAAGSSIDTMMADVMGINQLLPALSVNFPSYYVPGPDRRAVPLAVSTIGAVASSLVRSTLYESPDERDAVNAVLSQEAKALAGMSAEPDVMNGLSLQLEGLRRINQQNLLDAFTPAKLQAAYPGFVYSDNGAVINAAFAVDALKRNIVRCVSFAFGSFDTHFTNYRQQPLLQQRMFNMISTLVDYLDVTPHPTRPAEKLADHTHIMVFSDFCRTPQINLNFGRDHYPNNSSLIISPRFKGNTLFGKSDPGQLLPVATRNFADGLRSVTPPDILSTFVSAFGGDPRKYLRDGEVIPELLK